MNKLAKQTEAKNTYQIIFLRHAESVGNLEGHHQGQTEYPLTQAGFQQAEMLANYWQQSGQKFDLIISSPLERARQTAEILSNTLKASLEFDADWVERDNGVLSGLPYDVGLQRFPPPDFSTPFTPIGQHGESQWELYLRGGRAIQKLLEREPGSYLIVTHGGLLNMVMYAILNIPVQANFQGPRFRFANTAYAQFIYVPDTHQWQVLGTNLAYHLQERQS